MRNSHDAHYSFNMSVCIGHQHKEIMTALLSITKSVSFFCIYINFVLYSLKTL